MTLFVTGFILGAAVQALYCYFRNRKRGTSKAIVTFGPPEKLNR